MILFGSVAAQVLNQLLFPPVRLCSVCHSSDGRQTFCTLRLMRGISKRPRYSISRWYVHISMQRTFDCEEKIAMTKNTHLQVNEVAVHPHDTRDVGEDPFPEVGEDYHGLRTAISGKSSGDANVDRKTCHGQIPRGRAHELHDLDSRVRCDLGHELGATDTAVSLSSLVPDAVRTARTQTTRSRARPRASPRAAHRAPSARSGTTPP